MVCELNSDHHNEHLEFILNIMWINFTAVLLTINVIIIVKPKEAKFH